MSKNKRKTAPNREVTNEPKREVQTVYWKNPVFIDGQTVKGEVTTEMRKTFLATVKRNMTAEEFADFKFSDWVSDVDLEGQRRAEAIAKQKKNLGLA